MPGKAKFYAVRVGRAPGVYDTWAACEANVKGAKGAVFKSFPSRDQAVAFVAGQNPEPAAAAGGGGGGAGGAARHGGRSRGEAIAADAAGVSSTGPGKYGPHFHLMQFDGASKGNPGHSGAGVALFDPSGTAVHTEGAYLETATTVNVAEYHGLIFGLEAAAARGVQQLAVEGDSKLVINQVLGLWQINADHLVPLAREAQRLIGRFKEVRMKHVYREVNKLADNYANQGVETRRSHLANCAAAEPTAVVVAPHSCALCCSAASRIPAAGSPASPATEEYERASKRARMSQQAHPVAASALVFDAVLDAPDDEHVRNICM